MAKDIKLCPFCGRMPDLICGSWDIEDKALISCWWSIKCFQCGITTNSSKSLYKITHENELNILEDGYSEVIETWNRRAENGRVHLLQLRSGNASTGGEVMAKLKSCPCAPFFAPCMFEKQETVGCAVRRLDYALTEFLRAIPILCLFIKPFICDLFEFETEQEGR